MKAETRESSQSLVVASIHPSNFSLVGLFLSAAVILFSSSGMPARVGAGMLLKQMTGYGLLQKVGSGGVRSWRHGTITM